MKLGSLGSVFRAANFLILIAGLAVFLNGCGFLGNGGGANGLAAAKTAKKYLGVPYVYGGRTPSGFDCSGLTAYVYGRQGVKLPGSSAQQAKSGRLIRKRNLRPGDLVFFCTAGGRQVSHVGLYLGDSKFIHAPGRGKKVTTASLNDTYFKKTYHSARRPK
jgi:cell wall-associated NlpC family hydrolase